MSCGFFGGNVLKLTEDIGILKPTFSLLFQDFLINSMTKLTPNLTKLQAQKDG